ncbi:helix-turn-helix domain-containing protein [Paracraurococcus ruber]|uniref:Transcriptional regulator n=1 Tax=Paracraurococcus ruber TaxID=77675 RepID=A0ABS1D4Q1_9PROT|nr:helix-turn-helix transcriptional regulator [Paracraurococcus ruber]MBK1661827.1 transcriptional regulator [Paracraurococcus ruber]TDG31794.1 XRE family transcriptional regulator [Paracraurococcus ruber]
MRFADIGQQLRAYRLESGLRAEEIAARLGVSRAALYRYEKGEVIKLDTIRRLAELLKISPLSLLGIGIDYFSRPLAFLERLRQLEEEAEQVLLFGGAVCFQVASDAYEAALGEAWTEAGEVPGDLVQSRTQAEQALSIVTIRRRLYQQRRPSIIAILSEGALRRLLQDGVAPGLATSDRARARCRAAAATEVENIASLMEAVPIGLQIGLKEGADPVGNFMVLRGRDRAHVVTSPFPPDSGPAVGGGVATITAAEEAVGLHQRVAEAAWRDALKGTAAAARVRALLREAAPAEAAA